MGITGKDIMKRYEERNSVQSAVQSYSAPRENRVTAQDIMNRHEKSKKTNSVSKSAQTEPVEQTQKNTNYLYAQERLNALSESQKNAVEKYNEYMNMYRGATATFNADSLVGTNNAASYLDEAMKYKKESGLADDEFESYAKNLDTYKDAVKSGAYEEKRTSKLGELTSSQVNEITSYNLAMQQYKNSAIEKLATGQMADAMEYSNAVKLKKQFMEKYGVSEDDFDKYAQYVQETEDKQSAEKMAAEIRANIQTEPGKYGAAYTAADILMSPLAGIMATGESLKSFGYADKDAPVNTNSYLYALQNMGATTEETVLEEIDNPVGDFAYNVGVSTAKSALGLALGSQPLTLASFGGSAYSSALKNAQDKGISKERAMTTALGAGAAEIVFEKVSLDKLYDLYKTVGKTALKDTVKKVLVQSGIEASEEVFTELSNIITDGVINGDLSDYGTNVRNYQAEGLTEGEARRKANIDAAMQVAEAGLAGFISGGIMGGGTTVASKLNYRSLGETVNKDAETKAKIIESAQSMDDKTTAKEIVTNTKAEDITDEQMADVIESITEIDSKKVYDIFSGIAPVQVTGVEKLQTVGNEKSQDVAQQTAKTDRNYGVTNAIVTATNEPVIALKFDEVSKDKATVRLGNDTVVPLEEVQMEDRTMQNLYNFAATMNDTKAANAMLERYDGQPLDVYAQSCAVFYNAGQLKTASFEELVQNPNNANLIAGMGDKATLYQMFSLGQNAAEKIAPVQQENKIRKVHTEGKVIDNRTDKSDSRLYDLYEMVAKRTGLELTLNDSLEQGERGYFSAALGRIALSNKSNNQYEVLVHELMEYARTYESEKMQKVNDMVLRYAMSDTGAKNLTKTIKAYQDAYEQVEQGKTYQSASEEFVNDFLAGVFSTEEGVRDFVDFMAKENVSAEQQKSILQTVADFFRDIAKRISQYIEEHMLSDAAKMGLRADEQQAKQMRQMVLDVLEDTIGNEVQVEKDVKFSLEIEEKLYNQFNEWLKGNMPKEGYFDFGETPKSLTAFGAKKLPLIMLEDTIYKFTTDYKGHAIALEDAAKLPGEIANPKFLFKGSVPNSFVVVTDIQDKAGDSVIVAIHLDKRQKRMKVNRIASVYGKNNVDYYIENQIKQGNLLDTDKKRSNEWFTIRGLQLSKMVQTNNASIDSIPQSSENATKKSIKVELTEDSLGRKLSEAQIEYFKDSQVRDENGALISMYHGTPKGDFTVFRDGTYFTPNKEYADRYQSPSASSISVGKIATAPKTYEVYLNIKKPFDLSDKEARRIYIEEYVKGGNAMGINPYLSDAEYRKINTIDWTEGEDLREFLIDNGYDYDGLTLDEGADGGYGDDVLYRGKSYVVFSPEQIKSVDNANPTLDPDIRLSLDVDLMSILEEEYSQEENESASIIEEGFTSLQNVAVDKKTMHKLAYKLKKEYKSAYSIDDLTDNLTNVFAYLKDHPEAKYQDMVRIMSEVARPVIEESTDIDTWEKVMYDNFRSYFKGKTIRLNREQIAEVAHYYGSFENFRRQNFGSINFSAKNGTYLDSIWEELVQQSNFMLDNETYSADQPIALMDTLQALKPTKRNIYGMNTEQASYDLALDIFRQFFVEQAQEKANEKVVKKVIRLTKRQQEYRKKVRKEFNEAVERLRTYDREKRDGMRREYEIKLKDAKASMYAAVKDNDKESAKKYADMEKFYQEQIRLMNQETNEKILAIQASNRQNMANRRAYEEQKRVRERIIRNAKSIINYFNTNTDKRHIPEALKTPIAQFITSIDFVSERANPNSAATLAWQDSLNMMYRRLTDKGQAVEQGYEDVYTALNGENGAGDVLKDMSAFLEHCSRKRVTDLTVRELEWLDGIITALKRAITDINRLYVNKRTQSVAELGTQSMNELKAKKDKKAHAVLVEKGINVMDANMLDSRSYFDRLGEAAFSIYDELRTAFNERVWLLKEAQDYMAKTLEGLDVKAWTGEKAKVHDFVINGQHLQMTTAQIMSLYELNKRNQAKFHMTVGGIRPTVIGKGSKQIKRVTPVKLTSRDIDVICNTLTAEQKAVADKIQKFLGTNCAKWGNKASMQMYGYERYGAKNYFPIKTDGNTVDTKDDSKFWFTKNQGFTKETVKNASNPLIVSDIFEVFTKHVTDMASYSTYSAAMMDAMKWFNFRSTDLQGDVVVYDGAVKTEIERVYGNTYLEYFKKLIEDINAENKRGIESEIAELLTSNMKAASVGANLRVAIQQPTAYLRAAAVLDPKYLGQAVFKKSAMKKAKENSAITLWKSWGYFETSIGRSMQNVLTNQKTLKEEVVDKSMAMAQFMDDFTWGYLWNACELEISDKHKNVKYNSPEYLELVSKRFDEVVDQTQVVDTVLHKSHIMRSKNLFNKMVTSFMSEPTKSYNLLMNRIRDVYEGKKGAKKVLAKAVNAYVVTQILNALVVSVVDAYRDWKEDDKTFWEKYFDNFKENVVDNMNPLTMIPYAKDIISLLEGYDVARQDMQGISTLINGGRKITKYVTDEEYRSKNTLWEVCKELIKGGSQVFGAPAYNPLRDIEAIWNTHFPDMRIGGRIYTKTEDYNNMLDALLEDDTDAYNKAHEDLLEKGMEEDEIPSKIVLKAKERYEADELSAEEVTNVLMHDLGYEPNEAWLKVNREWKYGSKYGLLYDNIDAAQSGASRTSIQSEINELKTHGADESGIAAGITRKYKDSYLESPSANMKNLLITCFMYCGYTKDDAMRKIQKWSE